MNCNSVHMYYTNKIYKTYNVHRCLSDGFILLLKALDSQLVRLQFALEDAVLLLQRFDAFLR